MFIKFRSTLYPLASIKSIECVSPTCVIIYMRDGTCYESNGPRVARFMERLETTNQVYDLSN